jgi:hypothetical protein
MTTLISFTNPPAIARSATPIQPQATSPRRAYRERDFGVGYGRSSGYASQRQYANGWNGQLRFRCG